jgi:hypothetical protein
MNVNFSKLNTQALVAALAGMVISAVALAASLPVIGASARFASGLAAGIVCGSLCIFLMGYFLNLAIGGRAALLSSAGFFIRIIIFAGGFYLALRFGGYEGAAGFAIAYLAPYAGVALTPALRKLYTKIRHENADEKAYIIEDSLRGSPDRRYVLVKSFDTVLYYGGRRYVTHRGFRRVAEVREADYA